MTNQSTYRTITCGALRRDDIDKNASVCGWVHSRRDHGGLIFIDLRDHTGLVQVVCEPSHEKVFAQGEKARPEHVLQVQGTVRRRPDDTTNPDLPTGEVELLATEIVLLNRAATPPFHPEDTNVTDDVRLEHRVMHLRSQGMQRNLRTRHKMAQAVRQALGDSGFIEVETPLLTKSTPEGARDFLVPARNHPGHFYALPQSPQLFKQVLMAGGVDRYYQITRCFRDEDLRSGRQPEFTQIDMEMAFVNEADVMQAAELVVLSAFNAAGLPPMEDIPTMGYADSMRDYGTDAPDLSIDLKLQDIKEVVKGCGFKVFAQPAAMDNSRVVALLAPGGGKLSRKQIDDLTSFVRKLGAGGLAYMKIDEPGNGMAGTTSPITKFLDDDIVNKVVAQCQASAGDLVFFGAGDGDTVNAYMSALRNELGRQLELSRPGMWPVWIVDFPLFAADKETGGLQSLHHPFTAPITEHENMLDENGDPTQIKSRAYDLVVNGVELGGGSIRIHDMDLQLKVLAALGFDENSARDKFGFLLNTLSLGAPPHGGIAFGLDRMVAMAVGTDAIRDVIAFPKTQRGQCLFTKAPQAVGPHQLAELGLRQTQKEDAPGEGDSG